MIHRQSTSNAFTFVRVAALRAAQLTRGCTARVPPGHRHAVTAQREVLAGKVVALALPGDEGAAGPGSRK